MQNWLLYIAAFACSFAVAIYMTPVAKKLSVRWGAIAYPKSRGMHSEPIPQMGGFAIICGFFASMLILLPFIPELRTVRFLGLSVGALIIAVLGMLDDIYILGAKIKFFVQIVAALIVIYTGTRFHIMFWPFKFIPGVLDAPLTLVWIVGLTNAVNFIDGLDGLAAGVSSIGAICLTVLCVLSGSEMAVVFSATLAGSCLGFLPRNFSPAEIIMGDTGATFIGFMLACSSLIGVFKSYAILSIVVAVFALGLPIFDTAFAMARRAFNGKPIFSADRGHLHHRLVDGGYSHKQAVAILYAISLVCGLFAIILATKDIKAVAVAVAALFALIMMVAVYRKRLEK